MLNKWADNSTHYVLDVLAGRPEMALSKDETPAAPSNQRRLARICALKIRRENALNLFSRLSTLLRGDKLPVYTRAGLSRTVIMFAALFLTAVTTSAPAREFRAADTQSEDYPTVQALRFRGRLIEEKTNSAFGHRKPASPSVLRDPYP